VSTEALRELWAEVVSARRAYRHARDLAERMRRRERAYALLDAWCIVNGLDDDGKEAAYEQVQDAPYRLSMTGGRMRRTASPVSGAEVNGETRTAR
jgi:hypothetical protein